MKTYGFNLFTEESNNLRILEKREVFGSAAAGEEFDERALKLG